MSGRKNQKALGAKAKQTQEPKPKVVESAASVNLLYQQETVHNTILSWRVPDYDQLSRDVVYCRSYEQTGSECTLRVLKSEGGVGGGCLTLMVSSRRVPPNTVAEFLILDESRSRRDPVVEKAVRLRDGVYTARFRDTGRLLLDPESGYLRGGVLTVAFKYASDAYMRRREQKLGNPETLTDLDALCSDLRRMYLDAVYPDFQLHVGGHVFSAHRFVLSARSGYFQDLLSARPPPARHWADDALGLEPGAVHELLLYVYGGELRELSTDCMLRVYRAAVHFQVDPLRARCLRYFELHVGPENCEVVCRYAVRHGLTELKNKIVRLGAGGSLPGIDVYGVFARLNAELQEEKGEDR